MLGCKSPQFVTHGRMLKSLSTHLQDAPFYVDQTKGKVFVDFGNSLPIDENGHLGTDDLGTLFVAVPRDTHPCLTVPMISCGSVLSNTGHQTGIRTLPESRFSHHLERFHHKIWTQSIPNHWLSLRYYAM